MADLKRINRMVSILSLIERGGKVTPKGLAEHFGTSERSIYRDIKDLIVDFPIRFDDEKGSYRFVEGYSLKKFDLTNNEVKAMLASKSVVSKLGTGLSSAYDSLMSKIKTEAGYKTGQRFQTAKSLYWFDIDPVEDFSKVRKQFDAVQKAMDEGISLQITYEPSVSI